MQYKLTLICPINWHSNKTANINVKTYQFKTHCEGDSHSSKTANIILPGLMIKQRWMPLCLQAKYSIQLGWDELFQPTWCSWMNLNTLSPAEKVPRNHLCLCGGCVAWYSRCWKKSASRTAGVFRRMSFMKLSVSTANSTPTRYRTVRHTLSHCRRISFTSSYFLWFFSALFCYNAC